MGIVSTIPERCKRCYTCVRECPAKAIKVERGQAMVIEERCIVCGNCVKVCAQGAKRIQDSTVVVQRMLQCDGRIVACLAPSFPAAFDLASHRYHLYRWCYAPSDMAAFDEMNPGKVVAALRELGFDEVWEVALGAELVSREYAKLYESLKKTSQVIISTPCPAIVAYIEKFQPALLSSLAPIVSPMVATARAIRKRYGTGVKIVFIGPCIAKKNEIRDPSVAGEVDAVLTFGELVKMFNEAGIVPSELRESYPDSPPCHFGRSYPISGGLLKTAGLSTDILENDIVTTEGKDRVLTALRELASGQSQARFFDILFCEGCINGPMMLNDLSTFARKQILVNYLDAISQRITHAEMEKGLEEFDGISLARKFTEHRLKLTQPSEEEINQALRSMKKTYHEDQLNCGACGYSTCREKAIAVCQGLAEAEMCLPYLVEELQDTCQMLKQSHEELASAQERLVQTERLASMGQLSAGVAHEINNPLGTILLYSHMMLKQLKEGDPQRDDLTMIAGEATRCKNIVRGLLDFARQSRVSKTPTSMESLIGEVAAIMSPKAQEAGVHLVCEIHEGLPTMMIDRNQIIQMIVNLVANGVDAIKGPDGEIRILVEPGRSGDRVEIRIADNGCGIPPENLPKIFTPFFTTKEMGKGTGLGLAIAYGVVKMHSGDITVASAVGKGTTFSISLPVGRPEAVSGADA